MTARVSAFLLIIAPFTSLFAQTQSSAPSSWQIATAISPLPEKLRAGAKVYGYDASGKFVTLRPGTNDMICLADDPSGKLFHVACYYRSLEPFMARGRELRALKKSNEAVDSARARDIKLGKYSIPQRTTIYQYWAPRDSVNMSTGVIDGAEYLYVVYVPYSSNKSTGISEAPVDGGPWIMYPGKPWAHLMIQPQKSSRITIPKQ